LQHQASSGKVFMRGPLVQTRLPKAPIWRRVAAFGIDFIGIWLVSSLAIGNSFGATALRTFLFLLAWVGLRVFLVYRNQGQTLGRWLLDLKVIDLNINRSPDLVTLLKREGYLAMGALFLAIGLSSGRMIREGWVLLLAMPLVLDLGLAIADNLTQKALHDRIANTGVIQTSRGYSLDLKVKRLLAEVSSRVKK
jgi:uncharacterized RDD family membrane protein YckC